MRVRRGEERVGDGGGNVGGCGIFGGKGGQIDESEGLGDFFG